jgi:hypothetical protein
MFSPDEINNADLLALFAYWQSKHRDGRLPSRADVDPLEIPRLLKNIALLEVTGEAEDFVIALAGSRIEEVHGRSLKGVSIFELQKIMEKSPAIEQYAEVARTAEPRYREGDLKIFGKDFWYSHRLILPLSSDGARVDALLAGAVFMPMGEVRDPPGPSE